MVRLALLLALLLLPATALAGTAKVLVVAGLKGQVPRDRAVNARLGQAVTLYAVVKVGRGRRARHYSAAPRVRLRGRRVRPLPLARLPGASWRWLRVEPRPHHVSTASPNGRNPAYSNARLFGPRHGKWLGYDKLEYVERPVAGALGPSLTVTRTRPTHPRVNVNGGLGTMRYKVELRWQGRAVASPGVEAQQRGGISPKVRRVTFRAGDDLVGFLKGYFNVPNVFGSAGRGGRHQAALYQGADCADVIIGAVRAAGYAMPYTSVAGLKRYARPITPRLLLRKQSVTHADGSLQGRPAELVFGRDVRPGDLMLIDYYGFNGSPRRWDHIAVLGQDRGVAGRFDPADHVLHMGYLYGLVQEPASGEAPAYVQFLRFKPRVRRAMARQQRRLRAQR